MAAGSGLGTRLPAARRVKLWSPRGSLPYYCRRKDVVIDNGNILKSFSTWPELEKHLRSKRFSEGSFAKAEVHFPKVFAMNRCPRCKENCPTVTMQYLQHSTHSAEKDMIWDGEKATFKGNPKLASLHCVQQQRSTVFRIMTWRREGQSLRQLKITPCNACNFSGHHCNGRCCAIPLSEFSAVENSYVKLARMTCKQNAASLADMKTCNGECYTVEQTLPGSYIWFGVSEMNGPPTEPVHKSEFLRLWTRESVYGAHSFVADIHEMISAYRQQIANGRPVVFRCGGTLLYTHAVCYVVIVTHEGDGIHDNFPPVTSPLAADDNSRRSNWSMILDENGHCTKKGYPQFMPHPVNVDFWDHVVFAFHLPNGATLMVPQKNLIGGGPLHTEHRTCHKFRRHISKSGEVCAEEEVRYQRHTHDTDCDLSGISIDELFSSFEDADSSADEVLHSTPKVKSLSHLTVDAAGPVQSGSQEDVVDMADVSVEELFSSFEDGDSSADEVLHSTPKVKSHCPLTVDVAGPVQSGSQEDVVDMADISVEELFSSFEDGDSSADEVLHSTPKVKSLSHLTVDAEGPVQSGSQEDVVDMADVSVEELLSSFEDGDSCAEDEETESRSHLTREGMKHACSSIQEPVVDMANIGAEELFSRFEESPVTESQHLSSREGSYAPWRQSPADRDGSHALTTANTAQRVDPIAHSSPRLTRKRRRHVHYSVGDLHGVHIGQHR